MRAGTIGERGGQIVAGTSAVGPEAPATGAPEPGEPRPSRGRLAAWAGGALAAAFVVGGTWWVTAVHPGGHLSPPEDGTVTVCATRAGGPADGDVAFGAVLEPTSDVELTGLTLVGATNVVVDATVVPVVHGSDGGYTTVGAMHWPLSSADRAGLTLEWSSERDLAGAHLTAGVTEDVVLRVHADDAAAQASWSAIRVTYRTAGAHWAQTFHQGLIIPAGTATCFTDDDTEQQ